LQLFYARNYKFDESYFFAFGGNDESFHGGERMVFFGGLVKMKSSFSHSFVNLARKPRALVENARTINRLLVAAE
jgi:hypothetical protein